MADSKISACLVIRNEGKTLDRCLASLRGAVDEIIVVHDGECSDRSLEICQKYDAKIFIRPFVGAMEGHIAFAYREARGEWILRIDGDEYLSDDLKKNLRNLTQTLGVDAYEFLWPFWNGNERATKNWPYKICFFRKDRISFLGVVHYVTEVLGRVERSNLILGHEPVKNNYTWQRFRERWLRLAKIQAETYFRDINSLENFNYFAKDWPFKIRIRRRFSLLLAPLDFAITIHKNLASGGYREGFFCYKVIFLSGLYRAAVDYYIFKIKLLGNKFSNDKKD